MRELKEEKDPIEVIKKCNANTKEELEALALHNLAMEEAMMTLELEEYNNLSVDEKELIDYANTIPAFSRSEYERFLDQIEQRKEGYILDNAVNYRSEIEQQKYLRSEYAKIVSEITKSDIGRDYLTGESKEKLLTLFDTSLDDKYISVSMVVNLKGPRETFGEKRKKLIENLIPYFAIVELISGNTFPTESKAKEKEIQLKNKHLQDILKYPGLFQPIIQYLEIHEIIDKSSYKYIGTRNKTLMPGLLKILDDKDLLNEELSYKLARSVLFGTFCFDLKRDTFGKRGLADFQHMEAIEKIISEYLSQNIQV